MTDNNNSSENPLPPSPGSVDFRAGCLTDVATALRNIAAKLDNAGVRHEAKVCELAAEIVHMAGKDAERLSKLQSLCEVHSCYINDAYGEVILLLKSESFTKSIDPVPTIREIIDALPNNEARNGEREQLPTNYQNVRNQY